MVLSGSCVKLGHVVVRFVRVRSGAFRLGLFRCGSCVKVMLVKFCQGEVSSG
jgi:hypothetical protein